MVEYRSKTERLSTWGINEARIPQALILRGARDLKGSYETFRTYFTNVEALRPNDGVLQDVFLGERAGIRCAYASVYGRTMAAEAVHRFGSLGISLVVHTGCCVAKSPRIKTGDLLVVTEAYQGNDASGYAPEVGSVEASYEGAELSALQRIGTAGVHWGRVYSTATDYCGSEYHPPASFVPGCWAVDRETAAIFATAKQFGIHRTAILYVADPCAPESPEAQKRACRRCGEEPLLRTALAILKSYSKKIQTAGPPVNAVISEQIATAEKQKRRNLFWQAAAESRM
jgi:nucleoside phosphorylase